MSHPGGALEHQAKYVMSSTCTDIIINVLTTIIKLCSKSNGSRKMEASVVNTKERSMSGKRNRLT